MTEVPDPRARARRRRGARPRGRPRPRHLAPRAGRPYPIRRWPWPARAQAPGSRPRRSRRGRRGRVRRHQLRRRRRGVRHRPGLVRRVRVARADGSPASPRPSRSRRPPPISGLTALQAVRDAGRIEAGRRVLVIGASGGVGSLRRPGRQGATAPRSPAWPAARKADLVRSLGAAASSTTPARTSPTAPATTSILDIAGLAVSSAAPGAGPDRHRW